MGAIIKFGRRKERTSVASPSPPSASHILGNVAALLSQIERLKIHTAADMRQAFFLLELANTCIRLFIRQIDSPASRNLLLAQSARIDQLIEGVRTESGNLF
ncbi:hypothetical protein [Bradyrhizobium sp. RDM4]|uniref:hypothetical protein n=1 Tax=Bradyrhizobium sp. RDM4 TaxID=3378765 RepID=UPI0038FC58AD